MVVGYNSSERDGEKRKWFWNELDRIVVRVGNGYRLRMLGDLNGWIEDRVRAGKTGPFYVPGENDNGNRMVEFVQKWGLCMGNTYFIHKYTRVASGQDGVKVKTMIDLVLVKKALLHYVQDVRAVRGMGR